MTNGRPLIEVLFMDTFADRLASLMRQAGHDPSVPSQSAAFARRCGISRQQLAYLLAGTHGPSWSMLKRLAAGLGVSLGAFDGCD